MDTQSALSYASAAPFIALLLGYVFSTIPRQIDHKYTPLFALILATIWGLVLWQSNYWEGTAAVFIVTDITVAYAVGGIMSQARNIGTVAFVPAPKLPQLTPDEIALVDKVLAVTRTQSSTTTARTLPPPEIAELEPEVSATNDTPPNTPLIT